MLQDYIVGHYIENVILETFYEDNISRRRVRPIEYPGVRVEFPRDLRDKNPIGTKFIANVKIAQKTKNHKPYGRPYFVVDVNSISYLK